MPTISVIVPVYKVEQYVGTCVDSILEQSFTDFELILVDDGSPDRCGEICEEYKERDQRIRVIHRDNGGLFAARNTGLDAAEGSYITFIDSDDLVRKNYLEDLYQALCRYDADVSACNNCTFKNTKEISPEKTAGEEVPVILEKRQAVTELFRYGPDTLFVSAWGFLFKRTLFEGLRFPALQPGEDLGLIPMVLYGADRTAWLKKDLYCYRIREDSITGAKCTVKIFDDIKALDLCIDFFREVHEEEIVKAAEAMRMRTLSRYTLLARKYGFYHELPAGYRMGTFRAILYMRRHMSRDGFLNAVKNIYPRYVFLEAHFWRLLQILKLKK